MKSVNLMENWEFHGKAPTADPLYVDHQGRVLLFTLKAGQSIPEHESPHSPFYLIVLHGRGIFIGGDGSKQTFGPNSLLIFDAREKHSIRALDDLVFVGFMHGAPGALLEVPGAVAMKEAG